MTEQQMVLFDQLFEEACGIGQSELQAWLNTNCKDAEVRAELESMLPHVGGTGRFTSTVAMAASGAALIAQSINPGSNQQIGPYRIVGILGEGGMGTVYEGVREGVQFKQRVAVKVLRLGARSEAVRRRFLREQQILAALEHPNIARLLDGGTASDGSPYLVMERIEGESLTVFSESHHLSLRQRLELFREVANAVQYAHQKLVVHRDLKPGNILVSAGPDGRPVPKLLDFGIAKLLDESDGGHLTMTGCPLMTPDYASPEQVRGKPVSAAMDVYSLGAVLYELVTGVRPHGLKSYDPAEIADAICVREIPPPSVVATNGAATTLRGDLDTIVLKALQKDPERRYGSADQLSEDIRRYLSGMPVLARPDTAAYRIGKFVQRHWIAIGAIVGIVAASAAGAAVSIYEARLARERFELVRTLAHRFLFDFEGEIANLPGSSKAQQLVVNTAFEYLDKLSRTAGSDRVLLKDMADAYAKLASVQGGSSSIGAAHYEDALASQRKSVEYYRKLAAYDSTNRVGLARNLIAEASIERILRQGDGGLAHVQESVRIYDELAAAGNGEPRLYGDCAKAYLNLARSLSEAGRLPEALEANRRAQHFSEASQTNATKGSVESRYQLVILKEDEAQMLVDSGDLTHGIAVLEQISQTMEQLIAARPENRTYQRFLVPHLEALGEAYYAFDAISLGDPRKAEAVNQRWRELCGKLATADPKNGIAQNDWAISESTSAIPLTEIDPREAIELAQSGLRRWEELSKTSPGQFSLPRRARANMRLAVALLSAGRGATAITPAHEASNIFRKLAAGKPDQAYFLRNLALALAVEGRVLASVERDSEARHVFEESIALASKLLGKAQVPLSDAFVAAYAYREFGEFAKSRGEDDQARRWLEREHDVWAGRAERTDGLRTELKRSEERLRGLRP